MSLKSSGLYPKKGRLISESTVLLQYGHLAFLPIKFGESAVQKRGHTKGKNLGDSGPSKPPKEMCGGGKVKKMASGGYVKAADGIASKGKTKGKYC